MTSPAPLAGKLGLRPGRQAVVFNPPNGAIEALDPLPDGARVTAEAGETPADVVAVFVRDAAEVETWVAKAAAAVGPVAGSGSSIPRAESPSVRTSTATSSISASASAG